jgi:hypothetical protein
MMDMSKITSMLFPVMVSAIAWLLSQITNLQADVIDIKSKMPALITPQGTPTDSPISAEARAKMKEDLMGKISDLQVQVKLIEEREKQRGNK